MHELALSQDIVDMVVECAQREGIRRVTEVVVEVGAAAAVAPDALRFCFDAAAAETPVAGAELVIVTIAMRARCRACAREYAPESQLSACPSCGSYGPELLAGRELRVRSLCGS